MLDSSCLVALFSRLHPDHDRVRAHVEGRLDAGEVWHVGGHTLAETYSVLTRIPPPLRVSGPTALRVLQGNLEHCPVTWLEGADYWSTLADAATGELVGGAIYDALIAATAVKAGVGRLLTLNPTDLERVAPHSLLIERP